MIGQRPYLGGNAPMLAKDTAEQVAENIAKLIGNEMKKLVM